MELLTVEQALAQILEATPVLKTETVLLLDSPGRVLAEDVIADIAQPPFTNSAVDGYAVRCADVKGASETASVTLTCVAEIAAGTWPERRLQSGECARIMTGAPLPPGADVVVMVEDTETAEAERVRIRAAVGAGSHVRYAGEDVKVGERVLAAGTPIRAVQVGLLASMGRANVRVVRLPRVAVISTGDEVVEIESGQVPERGQIRNSNSYALAAMVRECGCELHSRRHVPDDFDATLTALRSCAGLEADSAKDNTEALTEAQNGAGADVIVTAGGVSVGDRDFVKSALEQLGTLELWRVAMKPGKPLAFGRIGNALFFGLPGNPVSAQVTFELFVRPCLAKMAGRPQADWQHPLVEAELMEAITHTPGRREYVRAQTEWQQGRYVTHPLSGQSSANLQTLSLANSLLVVPESVAELPAGAQVQVLLLR